MAGNFQNLMEDMNVHIQEAQWIPSRVTIKISTPVHITVKMLKDNENILKAVRGNWSCTRELQ